MTLVLCEGEGAGFVLATWDDEELESMDAEELGKEILAEVKRNKSKPRTSREEESR